ncbi:peptidylprolyl isomerase [Shimia thalassica]|uniref:peptidylprolyl isomerase n=1 Tax=Shimia thalassica TaxID=1715693 RepID=UPI00273383E3|nr:peptidylprolyl isomerase [Shimia thalassica]MDP2493682.1 peptidylprolyl isomerase [Shimia thalassica]
MRIFREPLFHFFLLGLLIFGWFFFLNPPAPNEGDDSKIVIGNQDVERLSSQFENTWRRRPTPVEMERILEAMVREEVLVREATKLGFDQGDSVVRARLAKKMEFLTTSLAQSMVPEDSVLIAYFNENADAYSLPPEIAFEQLLLMQGDDPDRVLAALAEGEARANLEKVSLLPISMSLSSLTAVDNTFGRGFFAQIEELPKQQWTGPVTSGFGAHLVLVTEVKPAALPEFESIRETVLLDWRREQSEILTVAQLEVLKSQYEIETPDAEVLAEWSLQ